jgi:hypothetical protein
MVAKADERLDGVGERSSNGAERVYWSGGRRWREAGGVEDMEESRVEG